MSQKNVITLNEIMMLYNHYINDDYCGYEPRFANFLKDFLLKAYPNAVFENGRAYAKEFEDYEQEYVISLSKTNTKRTYEKRREYVEKHTNTPSNWR